MPFGNSLEALLKLARVALAALLLVGVPMADAFACAGETSPSSASADVVAIDAVADSNGHSEDGHSGDDGQHCIHGHCHHGTLFRSDAMVTNTLAEASTSVKPHQVAVSLTRVPGGLERPPKA